MRVLPVLINRSSKMTTSKIFDIVKKETKKMFWEWVSCLLTWKMTFINKIWVRKLWSKSFLCIYNFIYISIWPKCSIFETKSSSNDKSVYLPTHFAIASAPKPTLCTSIVSIFFGLPLAGKCIKTGAEFNFMVCNEIKKLNKYVSKCKKIFFRKQTPTNLHTEENC